MQLNQYFRTLYYRGISANGMKAIEQPIAHALFPLASLYDLKHSGFQVAETGYIRYRDAFFFSEKKTPIAPPPPNQEGAIKAYETWRTQSQTYLDTFAQNRKTKYPNLFRYLKLRQAEAVYNQETGGLSHWKLYFAIELPVLVPIRHTLRYPDIVPLGIHDDWEIPLEYLAFAESVKTAPLVGEGVTVYIGSNGVVVGLDYNHLPLESGIETELWEVVQAQELQKEKLYNFIFVRMATGLAALHYPVREMPMQEAEIKVSWNERDFRMSLIPACKQANPLSIAPVSKINFSTAIQNIIEEAKKEGIKYEREHAVGFLNEKLLSDLEAKSGMRLSIDCFGYLVIDNENHIMPPPSKLFKQFLHNYITNLGVEIDVILHFEDESGGSRFQLPLKTLTLDVWEINRNIRGTSDDLDNSTFGFAMVFIHEMGHSNMFYGHDEDHSGSILGVPGFIEQDLNVMRKELGMLYGQRLSYLSYRIGNGVYIPFTQEALKSLSENASTEKGVVRQSHSFRDEPKNKLKEIE